jgi:uracil-DNA glycosylase
VARILFAGKAPALKVHESGKPFADASFKLLRDRLGLAEATFHYQRLVAILPMGFCYSRRLTSRDHPPRSECAEAWPSQLLTLLPDFALTIVLGEARPGLAPGRRNVVILERASHLPEQVVLPQPSPLNNPWLNHDADFEEEVLPRVRTRFSELTA